MLKFILNPRFNLIKNKRNTHNCLLKDSDTNEFFTLNEVIFSFLKFFRSPISLDLVSAKIAKKENIPIEEALPVIENFVAEMLSKNIIIKYVAAAIVLQKTIKEEKQAIPLEKFILGKLISTNTSIQVYLGKEKDSDKKVIIKVLAEAYATDKKKLTTFFKEFQTIGKFKHPNIVSLIEIGATYGVMEYFEGKELLEVLQQPITMAVRETIIKQMISGLAHLHQKGFIHGDLHPANILINKKNVVKIIDFDLASSVKSKTSRCGGIREFLAPEIISNDMFDFIGHRPNKRSEVYQIGILIYFILYGKLPIEKDTWKQHLEALQANQIEFAAENQFEQKIEDKFITLLQQCLSFSPQNRPASALIIQKTLRKKP
jgi:serine/threonine protein kinase